MRVSPVQGWMGVSPVQGWMRVSPVQGWMGVPPCPRLDGGTPPVQAWMGVPSHPRMDRGPPGRDGVPPPRYRTTDGVLDTPRSVCLLSSRRKTFFFEILLCHYRLISLCSAWFVFSLWCHTCILDAITQIYVAFPLPRNHSLNCDNYLSKG